MTYSVIDCDTGDKHEGCASIKLAHALAQLYQLKDYEIWTDKNECIYWHKEDMGY